MSRGYWSICRRWMVLFVVLTLGVAGACSAVLADDLGPTDVVASPDGKTLYVLNADAHQVAVVDAASSKVARSIALPQPPTGLALTTDGATLYVTCVAPAGTVQVVDVASGQIRSAIPVGHYASGPSVSADGRLLVVCNRFDNTVSLIDAAAGKELARVSTPREPVASALTPDGKIAAVANLLPEVAANADRVASAITLIDTASHVATNIRLPNGSSSVQDVCISPDGKYAYAVHILAHFQLPTTQLERGWMNTNAMSIVDLVEKKFVNTVLLDDIDLGAANPYGVTMTADGGTILVTHAGTHELSVIDTAKLWEKFASIPPDEETARNNPDQYADRSAYASRTLERVPEDLAFLVDIRERFRLLPGGPWAVPETPNELNSPRGLTVIGSKVYIAVYFSDLVAVVDLEASRYNRVTRIALGPRPQLSQVRLGEILFHDADLCFQHWQSCASCHPDARVDALNWDLMNDGMGTPKNVRSMLLAHATPPAMSTGIRPDAQTAVRAGIRHILFAEPDEQEALAIDEYLKSLEPVPSPHLVNGQLSEAARRGEALFMSERVGCAECHPKPLYTDQQMHDVASRAELDRRDDFDTPSLIEVWRTAPYMHDGHHATMKGLFVEGKHGDVDKLNEQELNDLVEFVLSL